MEDHVINQVVGQVLIYDNSTKQWAPAGGQYGLSMVKLIYCASNHTYRIHGQKIDGAKEVVLDNIITVDDKFNRANDSFVRWHDKHAFWGINFRQKSKGEGPNDADIFFNAIKEILSKIVNQVHGQNQIVHQQQPNIAGDSLAPNQQPSQQQNSASVIQRPIQAPQQIAHQQAVHQTMLQQQTQMMNMRIMNEQYAPQSAASLLNQGPSAQMIQQQHQSSQSLLQQQQMLPQYIQQQQQSQSHTNHSQINHYQHSHQQHMPQQYAAQQQIRQPPPQPQLQQQQSTIQQQSQPAQVVAAPIPPPPPPPPPAPSIASLSNGRVNGTSNNSVSKNNGAEAQQSPISSNVTDRNGGSPNQQTSILANELAKCQLKKVNLSRSDSEKESEFNNNNIGNPKTTRAASVAYGVSDSLMNDLEKKIASRREKIDGVNSQSNCSTNNIPNGTIDRGIESLLVDLIRKEINKEMNKMKTEILDAIKSELKQR